MASDDNETRLPERVERALAEARENASSSGSSSGKSSPGGRWLALIPMSIAFVMLALMMPRAAPPDEVPLPRIDHRALQAATKDDLARAERARAERLRDDVLAVGSALRAYQKLQAESAPIDPQMDAKMRVENALNLLLLRDKDTTVAYDALKSLRAVQLEQFLVAVKEYEATGKSNDDMNELGGSFVERMKAAGWLEGTKLYLDDAQRRAAFKTVWTAILVGNVPTPLAVPIDEQRVLYSLYISRPHVPETQRKGFEVRRGSASTPDDCRRIDHDESIAAEMWRADKVRKLGEIDPTYPTNYALGVSFFKAGHFEDAAQAFQKWIEVHPDGPWTLRARNHLKAALVAQGP